MQHGDNQPNQSFEWFQRSDGTNMNNHHHVPRGIRHSVRPGAPCPKTILVAIMTNGSYLLMGYPQGGPTALVVSDDVGPLWQALHAAFGSPPDEDSTSRNRSSKHTDAVPPGPRTPHGDRP